MSKLNCWPNCLAVVVRSKARNEGAIVGCVRIATKDELNQAWVMSERGPVWVIDRQLPHDAHGAKPFAIDADLRPLLPPPGAVSETEVQELYEPSKKSTPQTAEIASSDRAVLSAVLLSARAKKGETA